METMGRQRLARTRCHPGDGGHALVLPSTNYYPPFTNRRLMGRPRKANMSDRRGPWIRRAVEAVEPYVPGEQPEQSGLIKLNTNENPYPPSPKVLAAVRGAVDDRLRLYPNPSSQPLRERLARFHGCSADRIVVGNGSDELLALAVRAFVETREARVEGSRKLVQYLEPSYSLYPILADIHGAKRHPVALRPDFGLPTGRELAARGWDTRAALTFITTPNAPGGRGYSCRELERLCSRVEGVVVLDEAYVDFATESALELALRTPRVLVARTFSKAYCLCFQRVGYFVGHPRLIRAIDAIRDSYNVNGLGQAAALATLGDLPYYRRNFRRLISTRRKATRSLGRLGFEVFPSETNFLFVRPPDAPASTWFERLRERGILVRWFSGVDLRECMRITVGTDREMDALVKAARGICGSLQR